MDSKQRSPGRCPSYAQEKEISDYQKQLTYREVNFRSLNSEETRPVCSTPRLVLASLTKSQLTALVSCGMATF